MIQPFSKNDRSVIDILCFIFLFLLSISTFLFSFITQLDISGGGSSSDIRTHWKYMGLLNSNLGNLFTVGKDFKLMNFPLHHIIFSRSDFLSNELSNYLQFFFVFSFILPILFYFNLKRLFPKVDNLKILFYSFLIILLPNFQASAIWGNNHITAIIFLLLSTLLLNSTNQESLRSKLNIFLVFFFLALASYTRQYYVIFFPFFIIKILKKNKKDIFYVFLILLILALPGISYLILNPKLLIFNIGLKITNFYSSILITLSIIGFFLIPFFIMDLKENLNKLKNFYKNNYLNLILIIFLFIIILLNFKYDGFVGGGFFHKLSQFIFNNNLFFFALSFLSFLIIFSYKTDKYLFLILNIPIIISFSSGFWIFQKYFEPLIIIIFFLLYDKKIVAKIFDKNLIIPSTYFSLYWFVYYFYSKGFLTIN